MYPSIADAFYDDFIRNTEINYVVDGESVVERSCLGEGARKSVKEERLAGRSGGGGCGQDHFYHEVIRN